MDLISNQSIREITNIYMLANTPMFLYRHMRQLTYLEDLAKSNDLEVLLNEYERRTLKKDRLPEDIAIAYAILIAISHLEYSTALKYLTKFDLSRLEWGNEIKNIFHTRVPVETTVNLFTMPEISDTQQIRSDSAYGFISLQVRNNVTDEK